MKTQSVAELEGSAAKGNGDAKRELARRLMEGEGTDKNEEKAVILLEDCVAHGDPEAMVMLAKCLAFGCGTRKSAERAELLIIDASKKENTKALSLMKIINGWKDKSTLSLDGLYCDIKENIKYNILMYCMSQCCSRMTLQWRMWRLQ